MSWLGVAIGLGIAAVFFTLVFLILWLFPDGVSARSIRTIPHESEGEGEPRSMPQSPRMIPMRRRGPELRNDDQRPKPVKRKKNERTLCTYQDESRRSTVPGMEPASKDVDDSHTVVLDIDGEEVLTNVRFNGEDSISATLQFDGPDHSIPHCRNGNLHDISKAGSFHEFLMALHKEFGPIASFWFGTQFTVSIASPELFKQHQQTFNRPSALFNDLAPMFTHNNVVLANGSDWKLRRQAYDRLLNFNALGMYYEKLQKVADEVTGKWDNAEADDHFPLGDHMYLYSAKCALSCLMGDDFTDDKEAAAFRHHFHVVWNDIDQRQANPIKPKENIERAQTYKKSLNALPAYVKRAIKAREAEGRKSRDFLLIDAIIGHHQGDDMNQYGDAMAYIVSGFHTTSNLLTWCIYYLCLHEDVQEKLYKEISNTLGPRDPVTYQSIGKLTYLRQVLDETLRRCSISPWAARYSDEDIELGGHKIPANTPVVHALGVAAMDEKYWPAPKVFDPDRFSANRSKGRPQMCFSPFGFAGGRQCPGFHFAYAEASIFLLTAMQKFRFLLVPGQDVRPKYGLVTHPKEEIWFRVAKRL